MTIEIHVLFSNLPVMSANDEVSVKRLVKGNEDV